MDADAVGLASPIRPPGQSRLMDTTPAESVTLAILAGGEGSRMGFPKAELHIDGQPILAHLIRTLAWRGPKMLVTAPGRTQPSGADCFDREVVDPVPGEGPLRGVLTALEHCQTDRVIVATVDMPAITRGVLGFLCEQLQASAGCDLIMLRRGAGIEPFPSIYRTSARDWVRDEI